ncbi:MAG: hypothetical protein QNK03_27940, partial [Myxococcota bacterium]|nr:hypothetical protein [Myxococcota bacterium]
PSPLLEPGEVLRGFQASFNARGDLATMSPISADPGQSSAAVLAMRSGEPLRLIARIGDPAPGAPAGTVFRFFSTPKIDALGRPAFHANVGGSDDGIWGPGRDDETALYLIEGEPAPGLPDDHVVGHLRDFSINEQGQMLVIAGIDTSDPYRGMAAVYLAESPDALVLVVAEGTQLEVAPGDVRTIRRLDVIGRSSVQYTGLGSDGRVVFGATFEDGSRGAFLAHVEPAAREVAIDVRPRKRANIVRLRRRARLPVALLGSDTLDVADVDVSSLAFGPDGAAPTRGRGRVVDANRDGFLDLVLRFRVTETGLVHGVREACLTGSTVSGSPFRGCDAVRVRTKRPPWWWRRWWR